MVELKLLPCPWCGGIEFEWQGDPHNGWQISCNECWAYGPNAHSKAEAVQKWDDGPTHNIPDRLKAHADVCEAEARELEAKAAKLRTSASEMAGKAGAKDA
jgi:hypothetical protein